VREKINSNKEKNGKITVNYREEGEMLHDNKRTKLVPAEEWNVVRGEEDEEEGERKRCGEEKVYRMRRLSFDEFT
jgi:hypothetical protein